MLWQGHAGSDPRPAWRCIADCPGQLTIGIDPDFKTVFLVQNHALTLWFNPGFDAESRRHVQTGGISNQYMIIDAIKLQCRVIHIGDRRVVHRLHNHGDAQTIFRTVRIGCPQHKAVGAEEIEIRCIQYVAIGIHVHCAMLRLSVHIQRQYRRIDISSGKQEGSIMILLNNHGMAGRR